MFHLCETRFLCFIPVSIVTNAAAILVSHRATGSGPFWGLRSKGTTFYLSENPFFVPTEISRFFTKTESALSLWEGLICEQLTQNGYSL